MAQQHSHLNSFDQYFAKAIPDKLCQRLKMAEGKAAKGLTN